MATQIIAFPVAARQNTNDATPAFGKWFIVPFWPETLNLRGLIERVAFSQSVYSRDIIEGVLQKLTTVMVELLRSGQPVKWDGLGTFTPNINSRGINDVESVSVDQIQGVKINFIPENSKGEQLTSKAFKDLCRRSILLRTVTVTTPTIAFCSLWGMWVLKPRTLVAAAVAPRAAALRAAVTTVAATAAVVLTVMTTTSVPEPAGNLFPS